MKHYREDRWSLQARRQGAIVINVCYAQERWKPVFVRMIPNPAGTGCLMQEQFPPIRRPKRDAEAFRCSTDSTRRISE